MKFETWQELTKNEKCEMEIVTVINLGPRRSTRPRRMWKLDSKQTPGRKTSQKLRWKQQRQELQAVRYQDQASWEN